MQYLKAKFIITLLGVVTLLQSNMLRAQHQVKEIAFHLYTDSLKKGTYNYINVDALLDNEQWRPMDTSRISFASSSGQWSGNNLIVDKNIAQDSIIVKAFLKSSPIMVIEKTIYIKKNKDPEVLPSLQDVLNSDNSRSKKRRS